MWHTNAFLGKGKLFNSITTDLTSLIEGLKDVKFQKVKISHVVKYPPIAETKWFHVSASVSKCGMDRRAGRARGLRGSSWTAQQDEELPQSHTEGKRFPAPGLGHSLWSLTWELEPWPRTSYQCLRGLFLAFLISLPWPTFGSWENTVLL